MSHARARPNPPAIAQPCTRATVGLPSCHISSNSWASQPRARWWSRYSSVVPAGVLRHHAREVGAGTEGLVARPGQDHHPHSGVHLGQGQFPAQSGDDVPGHGVAALRSVDGERQDGPGADGEQVVGTGGRRSGGPGFGIRGLGGHAPTVPRPGGPGRPGTCRVAVRGLLLITHGQRTRHLRGTTAPSATHDAPSARPTGARRGPAVKVVHAHGVLEVDRPLIMGVVNASPESFSDSEALAAAGVTERAAHALAMAEAGAHVVDIGGQSARTDQPEIPVGLEVERVGDPDRGHPAGLGRRHLHRHLPT